MQNYGYRQGAMENAPEKENTTFPRLYAGAPAANGGRRIVFAPWPALEPAEGHINADAAAAVREALALVQALPQNESNQPALEVLTRKAEKAKKRQQEAKAHQRNLRRGKKHVK